MRLWQTLLLVLVLFPAQANSITDTAQLKNVGITEKMGASVPGDITLTDHTGKRVTTGSFFDGKKPALLHLVFYTCPHNCKFAMQFLGETANALAAGSPSLKVGDYKVLTVSFDVSDTAQMAAEKAEENRRILSDGQDKERMMFFTAAEADIKRLTDSVGYGFRKEGSMFDHQSALIVLTPEGRVSRYLYGIQHDPKDVRLALIEASNGNIGGGSSAINKVLLFCYKFDPVGGKYALRALALVKISGVVTLLVLTVFLYRMWKRKNQSEV